MTKYEFDGEIMKKRYAVITAYNGEEFNIIKRCHDSVKKQIIPTDHIIICDGKHEKFLNHLDCRIIILDKNHGDYGNTPRSVGATLLICEKYDGFCFCDADNWLESDHVETCLNQAMNTFGEDHCDCIITARIFRTPDEKILNIPEDNIAGHVDTNCLFYFPGSYYTLITLALIPKELTIVGDRVYWTALRARNLNIACTNKKTVNYTTLWLSHYIMAHENVPTNTRKDVDKNQIEHWKNNLSTREKEIFERGAGLTIG